MKRYLFAVLLALSLGPCALAQVTGEDPQTRYRETDQALPAGYWRIRVQADTFRVERNTAAGGTFATALTPISISSTGGVTLSASLNLSSASMLGWNSDTLMARDGVNIVSISGTSGSPTLLLKNSATDWLLIDKHPGSNAGIYTGDGSNPTSGDLYLGANGVSWFIDDATGHFAGAVANTNDILGVRNGQFLTSVSIGSDPATTGLLRMQNDEVVFWRNGANDADIPALGIGPDNKLYLGGAGADIFPGTTSNTIDIGSPSHLWRSGYFGAVTLYSTTLLATGVSLADGAAAQAGTLLNAPAAGNPSKWIPINDNGTTRYIPAW
jgi:hypothetical protein